VVFNNTLLRVTWENPWITGNRLGAGVRANYQSYRYVYEDFDGIFAGARITTSGFALSAFHGFAPRSRVYFQAGYQWTRGDQDGITIDPDGDRFPVLELGAEWDRRRSPSYPFHGTYALAIARTAGPFDDLYGIVEGVLDARAFHALTDEIVVAGHTVLAVRDGRNIPIYRRQHIGGGKTLRGWEYGTFNANNSFIAGVELRAPVNFSRDVPLEDVLIGIEVHAFADTGIAWERASQFAADGFNGGAGIGVSILNRQVQGLRLDYGWRRNSSGLFHVEIGLMF